MNRFLAWSKWWWQIFRDLDNSRAPITKEMFYFSLGSAGVSAILYSYSAKQESVGWILTSILALVLSVSTSLTAAAIVDLSSRMREASRFKWEQKAFRALFNCDLDTRSVAIVLPQYASKEGKDQSIIERTIPEHAPADFQGWVTFEEASTFTEDHNEISSADIYSASFCDIVAASHLIAAFAENKLPIPDIIWDRTVEDKLKGTQYKTYIAIGLFSNKLTALVNAKPELPQRMFRLQVGSHTNLFLYDYARILLALPEKPENLWRDLRTKPKIEGVVSDIALFAKVPFNGKSVIVCGGTTAEATRKLGNYIYEKWQEINSWQDDKKTNQIVGNSSWFSITFEIDVYDNDGSDATVKDVSKSGVRVWD